MHSFTVRITSNVWMWPIGPTWFDLPLSLSLFSSLSSPSPDSYHASPSVSQAPSTYLRDFADAILTIWNPLPLLITDLIYSHILGFSSNITSSVKTIPCTITVCFLVFFPFMAFVWRWNIALFFFNLFVHLFIDTSHQNINSVKLGAEIFGIYFHPCKPVYHDNSHTNILE